jgi:hypothetical protein
LGLGYSSTWESSSYVASKRISCSRARSLTYRDLGQIIAATVSKVSILSNVLCYNVHDLDMRETSVAIYIANLHDIWPLLLEHICFLHERTRSNVSRPTRTSRNGCAFHVNARNGYPLLKRGLRSHTTQFEIESDEVEHDPSRPDALHKSGPQSTVEAIAENSMDQKEQFGATVSRDSGKTHWDLEQGTWK